MEGHDYPWFELAQGDALQQGDIITNCPVFVLPPDLDLDTDGNYRQADIGIFKYDVIVMTHTCDIAQDKAPYVFLCPVFTPSCFQKGDHITTPKGLEDARRGNLPAYHMVAKCELPGFDSDVRLVDFRQVFSLPIAFLRALAARQGGRVRLLPPYREHLSQAFARFFMRVGLPVDIPPFK